MLRRPVMLAGLAATMLASLPARANAAALFDFEGQPIGAQTPFTATAGGLGATFAGPSDVDPGAFQLSYNSSSGPLGAPYRTLTGAFLTVGTAFGAVGSLLTIAFSAPLSALSLRFALDDTTNATALSLTTDAGGAQRRPQRRLPLPGGHAVLQRRGLHDRDPQIKRARLPDRRRRRDDGA